MKTTIDAAGRVVIPKKIREAARMKPGAELDVRLVEGVVELEPAGGGIRLEKKGRFLVAVPLEQREALTVATVRSTLEEVRGGGKGTRPGPKGRRR